MGIKNQLKKIPVLVSIFRKYKRFRKRYDGINWNKTIYINFKTQTFRNALKLPIFIYGKVTIRNLSGKIIIDAPITRRMICIGLEVDQFSSPKGSVLIYIPGTMIFKGHAIIAADCCIDVSGTLTIGNFCLFGTSVKIRCWDKITIGKGTRITVECQVFDTNFHYMRNVVTGKIYPCSKKIDIGCYSWIGNRTTIMKGTRLPDYSIVAGNSLLNKDFTQDAPQYPTIAGIPAKVVGSGNIRVFSVKQEVFLNNFFRNRPDRNYYLGEIGIVDEDIELLNFFQNPI